jgi:hypothetical protein
MSTANTVWVHGNAFLAQNPDELEGIDRVGWGTNFRGSGNFAWFHISIPFSGHSALDSYLTKIFFLYEINAATIRNIDVHDGRRKIHSVSGLNLEGDLANPSDSSSRVSGYNSMAIDPAIFIHFGLGLSIGVQFDAPFGGGGQNPRYVLFTAAGASFGSAQGDETRVRTDEPIKRFVP